MTSGWSTCFSLILCSHQHLPPQLTMTGKGCVKQLAYLCFSSLIFLLNCSIIFVFSNVCILIVFCNLIVICPCKSCKSRTLISYHYTGHLVLFMEHHSMGALDVFCILIQMLGHFRPHSQSGWGSIHSGVNMLVMSYEGHSTLTPYWGRWRSD